MTEYARTEPDAFWVPEGLGWQYAEACLVENLPDLVAAPRNGVGLHFLVALVGGELEVAGQVRDGEAVALLLLNLGHMGAAIFLLVLDPAHQLFEDCGGGM